MKHKIYKNIKEAIKEAYKEICKRHKNYDPDRDVSEMIIHNLIGFKLIHKDAKLPQKAHETDVGMDLSSVENVIIPAHKHVVVKTGLVWEPSYQYNELQIRPRSGLAAKHGITVLNSPGSVDSSYRGEICVILINHSDIDYEIKVGDRIAQAVLPIYDHIEIFQVEEVSDTTRGTGKFGSSGKN